MNTIDDAYHLPTQILENATNPPEQAFADDFGRIQQLADAARREAEATHAQVIETPIDRSALEETPATTPGARPQWQEIGASATYGQAVKESSAAFFAGEARRNAQEATPEMKTMVPVSAGELMIINDKLMAARRNAIKLGA